MSSHCCATWALSIFNVSVPAGQEGLPFFFSIDLHDVPILLLEQAHQIDIRRR